MARQGLSEELAMAVSLHSKEASKAHLDMSRLEPRITRCLNEADEKYGEAMYTVVVEAIMDGFTDDTVEMMLKGDVEEARKQVAEMLPEKIVLPI
jgi:hypothetical protein